MKRTLWLTLAFLLLWLSSAAADSFTFYAWGIPCGVGDQVIEWPGDLVEHIRTWQWATVGIIGAQSQRGIPKEFIITATEIVHDTNDPFGYAVIGKLDVVGSGGDYISRFIRGRTGQYMVLVPEATFRTGDQLHIHATCSGPDTHDVYAVIYFRPIP